jgi:hypothetical protein
VLPPYLIACRWRFVFTAGVKLPLVFLVFLLSLPRPARADENEFTADELSRAPAPARVAALVDRAATQGWVGEVPALRSAAISAYEANRASAPAWYYLYRWAALLSLSENEALSRWAQAVDKARVGHPNMHPEPPRANAVLAARWSRELHLFALGSFSFSEEFFTNFQPVDNPVEVLSILQRLYGANPARFADYQSLAIAIAVVYDVPPPPSWPHGQVSAAALPRKLPAPEEAFAYWTGLDHANLTLQHLRRLPASELKFIVDEVAPFSDLDWARKNLPVGLPDLAKAYDLIRYRKDRWDSKAYMWNQPDYHLTTILREGGICVDQAYFASVSGKAKGIPTIMFLGQGLDGRHAWFGYLDGVQKWELDCGRYAEQKLDVGIAYDPQTWGTITDFELRFLSDRFRALPTYKLSLVHSDFAGEYLQDRKIPQALKAAREAVNRDRRNLDGWNILLQAQTAATSDPRVVEGVLREAILAFQQYPDLVLLFTHQLAASMRARGEASAADFEEKRLAKLYQSNQGEVSCQQAADIMERSMREDALPQQVRTYQQVLDTFGRGQGYEFFDRVVVPFARYLQKEQQVPAALSAVDHARKYLRIDKGGQLDDALTALSDALKSGN